MRLKIKIIWEENKALPLFYFQMFSFTTITEELGAQGTVKLLNEYFSILVDCITDEGGMLDKFIGDAMMCILALQLHMMTILTGRLELLLNDDRS